MWEITNLPTNKSSRDYIGWLKHGDIHIKISISPQGLTDEHARLIIQHFAGIITTEGLMECLPQCVS